MLHTPLYEVYETHGAKVVDFHGWALPLQFKGIVEEHLHTRNAAGLFDCSHMGEFLFQGKDSIAALDQYVFGDFTGLKPGRCRYSALMHDDGGIIDDCVALRLDEDSLYLVTNAGPLDEVTRLLCNPAVGAENLCNDTAKIDIQGPVARDVLLSIGFDAVKSMRYWEGLRLNWKDVSVIITRGGYTGELGYELFVQKEHAEELWRLLVAHPAVEPAGLGARDTLRLEMGYLLNGQDITPERTPLEAGLERFIDWNKDFRAREVLKRQYDSGNFSLVTAIRSNDRRAPRQGFSVKESGNEIGVVSSGTFSPSTGCGIGLAMLPRKYSTPGITLTAGPRDIPVTTTSLPFYTKGTCRIRF